MDAHARYLRLLLGLFCAVFLPILALNLMLIQGDLDSQRKVLLSSAWQQASRGVTYAPPLSANRPFKTLRLHDRMASINAVVLGSSTMLAIREAALSPALKIYNFAQTGNLLLTVIGEAEYLLDHEPGVKWLVIPLDWSLGFIYQQGQPAAQDLSAQAVMAPAATRKIPLVEEIQDAISLPRIKNLGMILRDAWRSDNRLEALQQVFLEAGGKEYRCADGSLAKDFDTINRGSCTGFRFDGSATFGNLEAVDAGRLQSLVLAAVVPSSKYSMALTQSRGEPNPVMLNRLTAIARQAEKKGGGVLFVMPPLLPGMEKAMLQTPHAGHYLAHTKGVLAQWAERGKLTIIDAGQSEKFGCLASEFVDQHHALPACYQKIFADTRKAGLEAVQPAPPPQKGI